MSQARRLIVLARLERMAALAKARPAPEQGVLVPTARAHAVEPTRTRVPPSVAERNQALGWAFPTRPLSALPAQVSLRSTNIDTVAYDSATQLLTVRFRKGRTYVYSGVPRTVYAGLLGAASHGRYLNQWIKGRYPYRPM